jgi:hypothetical protein
LVGDKQFERKAQIAFHSANKVAFFQANNLADAGGFPKRLADFSLSGINGKSYNARNEHIRV